MKRNGYYIAIGESASKGVKKKIDGQIKEMEKISHVEKIVVQPYARTFVRKLVSCLPYCNIGYDYSSAFDRLDKPDYIYLRRTTADRAYVDFFRKIKKKFPGCRIIVEIPTYPYFKDNYAKNIRFFFSKLPYYMKEIANRGKLKRYVDRFVTFSEKNEIYGISTIRTINGIDVDSVTPVAHKTDGKSINLISVSATAPHHGYERIIKGLGRYYGSGGSRNVVFHVVGAGRENEKYKKLVKKYGLERNVIFYGEKTGAELDEIYNKADIAVESFALYRVALDTSSTLKSREYLAKGLPIVAGCRIDALKNKEFDYFCEFRNDNSVVDIDKIIAFYDRVYSAGTPTDEIRNFARENVDMSVAMRPVIEYILS